LLVEAPPISRLKISKSITRTGQHSKTSVISGGARIIPNTLANGTVWIVDLRKRAVVATVTGVGNDPYGLAVVDVKDDDQR